MANKEKGDFLEHLVNILKLLIPALIVGLSGQSAIILYNGKRISPRKGIAIVIMCFVVCIIAKLGCMYFKIDGVLDAIIMCFCALFSRNIFLWAFSKLSAKGIIVFIAKKNFGWLEEWIKKEDKEEKS